MTTFKFETGGFTDSLLQSLGRLGKHISESCTIVGGRNAAFHLAWFSDFGICMEDDQGDIVVSIAPRDFGVHGQWMVYEYARDTRGREWIHFNPSPMVMDDFGTLVEVAL
jgi:hypothetical protein